MKRMTARWGWLMVLGLGLRLAGSMAAQEAILEPVTEPAVEPAAAQVEIEADPAGESADAPRRFNALHDVVVAGEDVLIPADQVTRNVVVFRGKARIEGEARGNVVVISGRAQITGRVQGSVVSVLGSVTLGQNGRVRDNVVAIGGPIKTQPTSHVGGERIQVPLGLQFERHWRWVDDWLKNGLFFARPLAPRLPWTWATIVGALLLFPAVASLFPRSLNRCVRTLEEQIGRAHV